jgi:rod shape-determining protein MreC
VRLPTGNISRLGTLKSLLQRFAYLSLIGLTGALMLIGKADTVLVERARDAVTDAVTPVLRVMSEPAAVVADFVNNLRELGAIREENAALRDANTQLLQWQAVAQKLETENKSLRELSALVPEPGATFVTARVVADTGGAFAQSILITAGHSSGVTKGQVVMTGDGLVGRVMQAGMYSARVLLLTDINSRIPVQVGEAGNRAILAGDNSLRPRLLFLGNNTAAAPGDKIVTSGDAEAFPPGIPIGQVARVEDGVVDVEPFVVRDKIQHVRVADYGLSGMLSQQAPAK